MKHIYSPHPIDTYFIPGADVCEFRQIAKSPWAAEIWNLLWLSLPTVDSLPGSTATGYWRRYSSWPEIIKSVVADATQDEVFRDMLTKPPAVFHAWFCAEADYTIYDTWDVCGPTWVEHVADRSDEASLRRLSSKPFLFAQDHVLRIDYRKAA